MSANTTALSKTRGFSEETLREISWSKMEPEWLRQRRLEAWQLYERMPMPSRKEEEWRRTDLSMLDLAGVVPFAGNEGQVQRLEDLPEGVRSSLDTGAVVAASSPHSDNLPLGEGETPPSRAGKGEGGLGPSTSPHPAPLPRGEGGRGIGAGGGLLVQHNSQGAYRHLSEDLAARGVILTDLDSAAREHPELVKPHLTAHVSPAAHKFAALHAAFWSGGTLVYVPENVEVELPLHALTWADSAGLGVMPHTLVILEPGAGLVFVDELASPAVGAPALGNAAVELVLGRGARLRYVALQRWADSVHSFGLQRASVGRDAELASLSVVLGSKLTKSWVEAGLLEQGASAQLSGIMFAGDHQRFHHHTVQDHLAPNTTSDLLFKGALVERARSEYSGLIRVHPGAQKTDAYQANRNLLLSPHARADSMPKLEILNNDVRCTHGATVGPIDPEQVFYLMARGLPRAAAERMIVQGFFEPLIERIPLDAVQARVRRAVDEKLSGGAR